MNKVISDETKAKYINSGGAACPKCGSVRITGQEIDIGLGYASQECVCDDCDFVWRDIYRLVEVEPVE